MDIRQLEYFLAVTDHGGITRAAAVLHIAQPSLSQAIRGLERELRVSLFHRVGRGMVLTSSGEALVGPARQAVRSVAHAREVVTGVRQLEAGRVDIVALPSLAADPVAAWVGVFRGRYPSVAVRIDESDDQAGVLEAVRSGASELGFVTLPVQPTGIEVRPLSKQFLVLVRPPGTEIDASEPLPLKQVSDIPLIVDGRHTMGWNLIEQALNEHGADISAAVEVRHPSSTLELVLAGAGSSFMPLRTAIGARARGVVIQATEPALERRAAVIHRSGALSVAANMFLELAVRDSARWVSAIRQQRSAGLNYVDAAEAVIQNIRRARDQSIGATGPGTGPAAGLEPGAG